MKQLIVNAVVDNEKTFQATWREKAAIFLPIELYDVLVNRVNVTHFKLMTNTDFPTSQPSSAPSSFEEGVDCEDQTI